MNPKFDKSKLDVTRIFLVYVSTVGDVERTALALDLDPEVVQFLAESEGWVQKLRRLTLVSGKTGKESTPVELLQNRALNWVQCHRFRQVIDNLVRSFYDMDAEELLAEMQPTDKEGHRRFSARPLADLASAMEKVQAMSYNALGDTPAERKKSTKEDEDYTAGLHASLIAALNSENAAVKMKPSDLLVTDVARELNVEPKLLEPPKDAGAAPA